MLSKVCCLSVLVAMIFAEQKVPVSVYYESLCPDSIAFITKQLVPAYNTRLKNHMDLNLVPYGKASHQKSADGQRWEFRCHHGPVECYGNKVQGCVLKQIRHEDDQVKYINCLMNQAKTIKNEYPLGNCISGGDLGLVTSCANSTHGADVLAANGDVTASLSPPLTSVPTVVFNQIFNKTDQDLAQKDFKKVLCSYLKDECPSECKNFAAAAASLSTTLALLPLALLPLALALARALSP